jgi:hypothetical protein
LYKNRKETAICERRNKHKTIQKHRIHKIENKHKTNIKKQKMDREYGTRDKRCANHATFWWFLEGEVCSEDMGLKREHSS